MNKILKILSILVIGFVMFSCSTPTNDPETPAPNPEVQTYSITFTTKDNRSLVQIMVDYLNTLPEFKNLKEGTEVVLLKYLYTNDDASEFTKEKVENSMYEIGLYYNAKPGIDSVFIGNENIEVEVTFESSEDI